MARSKRSAADLRLELGSTAQSSCSCYHVVHEAWIWCTLLPQPNAAPPQPPPAPPPLQAGAGSATLSMAYAAAKFAEACLQAMRGDTDVTECAFVASALTEHPFFASPLRLGPSGVQGACGEAGEQVRWVVTAGHGACLTA